MRITSVSPATPRNGSDTLSVTFTRPQGSGCRMTLYGRLMRRGVPPDTGGANEGRIWSNSLESTVARMMISAGGTSQLLRSTPPQLHAYAGTVDSVNATAINPIRNHMAAIKFTFQFFTDDITRYQRSLWSSFPSAWQVAGFVRDRLYTSCEGQRANR